MMKTVLKKIVFLAAATAILCSIHGQANEVRGQRTARSLGILRLGRRASLDKRMRALRMGRAFGINKVDELGRDDSRRQTTYPRIGKDLRSQFDLDPSVLAAYRLFYGDLRPGPRTGKEVTPDGRQAVSTINKLLRQYSSQSEGGSSQKDMVRLLRGLRLDLGCQKRDVIPRLGHLTEKRGNVIIPRLLGHPSQKRDGASMLSHLDVFYRKRDVLTPRHGHFHRKRDIIPRLGSSLQKRGFVIPRLGSLKRNGITPRLGEVRRSHSASTPFQQPNSLFGEGSVNSDSSTEAGKTSFDRSVTYPRIGRPSAIEAYIHKRMKILRMGKKLRALRMGRK